MAVSRAETLPGNGETTMPHSFSALLRVREFGSKDHFLVLGGNRDTLVSARKTYSNGTQLVSHTLVKGKLRTTYLQGEDIPIGENHSISDGRGFGQTFSCEVHSTESSQAMYRTTNNPLRLLKRMARADRRNVRR